MKVYVVQADNCEDCEDWKEFDWAYFSHWTEGVFSSGKLAQQYIEKQQARYETMGQHYWIEEYEMI